MRAVAHPGPPVQRRLQAEPRRVEVPCGPRAEFVVRVRPVCPLAPLVPELPLLPPVERVLRRRPPELRFLRERASQAALHLFLEPRRAPLQHPEVLCVSGLLAAMASVSLFFSGRANFCDTAPSASVTAL